MRKTYTRKMMCKTRERNLQSFNPKERVITCTMQKNVHTTCAMRQNVIDISSKPNSMHKENAVQATKTNSTVMTRKLMKMPKSTCSMKLRKLQHEWHAKLRQPMTVTEARGAQVYSVHLIMLHIRKFASVKFNVRWAQ